MPDAIEIRGDIAVEKSLIRLGEDVARNTLRRAGAAAGRVFKQYLEGVTPTYRGLLRQNVYNKVITLDGGFLEVKVSYRRRPRGMYKGGFVAQILTSGRKRASRKLGDYIVPRTKKVLADVVSGKIFGRKAKPGKITPRPFVRVAYDIGRNPAIAAFNNVIETTVRKYNKG